MGRGLLGGALALALVLAACGRAGEQVGTGTPATTEQRWWAVATVLQSGGGPPVLCAGAIAASLPPQCGGPPIVGWDWSAIGGAEAFGDVRWVDDVEVVGTFDGATFTLTAQPRHPPTRPDPLSRPVGPASTLPCPAPPGGWPSAGAARGDLSAAVLYVNTQPDAAGVGVVDSVLVAAFTGDLDRHRAELAALWTGPTCLVQRDHSASELRAIATEATTLVPAEFGVEVLQAGGDGLAGVVELVVLAADADLQARIEQRFDGAVEVRSRLHPEE